MSRRAVATRKKTKNLAVGTWEAAALLGVHWTQVRRMADKGLLTVRSLKSPTKSDSGRVFAVYSSAECNKDYEEYEERMRAGGTGKRARTAVDLRPGMLKSLAGLKQEIEFGDAIGTYEAAEILGVHWSFPQRLAARGDIVGRVLASGRKDRSAMWIFSRASCEANASLAQRLQAIGKKKGRRRQLPA